MILRSLPGCRGGAVAKVKMAGGLLCCNLLRKESCYSGLSMGGISRPKSLNKKDNDGVSCQRSDRDEKMKQSVDVITLLVASSIVWFYVAP